MQGGSKIVSYDGHASAGPGLRCIAAHLPGDSVNHLSYGIDFLQAGPLDPSALRVASCSFYENLLYEWGCAV